LWIHIFFGTEAEVTDLGFYDSTDCPNFDTADPAYTFVMTESLEATSAYGMQMGSLQPLFEPKRVYIGDYYDGCSDSFGNSYVINTLGDTANRAPVVYHIGPMQPKASIVIT